MELETRFLQRCFDLAKLGAGAVSPNPMVGAVLVHNDRIIGEGYHAVYGGRHAEVNAVENVEPADVANFRAATLYVSLEPCCVFGKTPPCTNLILEKGIKKVVVSNLDQSPEVAGKGLEILRQNGVNVQTGTLEKNGDRLSRIRNTFVTQGRPYVILKFAQSANGFIGKADEKVWISNDFSNRLVHKWRSETDAILVGTATAKLDDPALTTRHYFGKSPIRVVIDKELSLPPDLQLFRDGNKTIVVCDYSAKPETQLLDIEYLAVDFSKNVIRQVLVELARRKITSLLVEGGAFTMEAFLKENMWDEARIITSTKSLTAGVQAPKVIGKRTFCGNLAGDIVEVFSNFEQSS
jgi:diaminohydroxyphosphoribosylaminopyrimidine deaminase/5-amino-6-(5-phosphoribosylamino)uracil reductase